MCFLILELVFSESAPRLMGPDELLQAALVWITVSRTGQGPGICCAKMLMCTHLELDRHAL